MAAHGLTIMRQMREMILKDLPQDQITYHVGNALSAPGTCFTKGFQTSSWTAVERMNEGVKQGTSSLTDLLVILDEAIRVHLWMDAYPCMEAVEDASRAYVKFKKPYWKKRYAAFENGDAKAHARARASIVERWPLNRVAPQF
jgi:hypothetical protein